MSWHCPFKKQKTLYSIPRHLWIPGQLKSRNLSILVAGLYMVRLQRTKLDPSSSHGGWGCVRTVHSFLFRYPVSWAANPFLHPRGPPALLRFPWLLNAACNWRTGEFCSIWCWKLINWWGFSIFSSMADIWDFNQPSASLSPPLFALCLSLCHLYRLYLSVCHFPFVDYVCHNRAISPCAGDNSTRFCLFVCRKLCL